MADEPIKLGRDDSIALWKQGRDAWNAWVEANPVATVLFTGVNFGELVAEGDEVSFSWYKFPTGHVSFANTTFGDGGVSFQGARFEDGEVNFFGAKFGNGEVYFVGAAFGDGDVSFASVSFGDVDFQDTTFGNGGVSFQGARFRGSRVSFYGATFGYGSVSFQDSRFGDCGVYFANTTFGAGHVSFANATFRDGDVSFTNATFGAGNVSFANATFGDGDVYFAHTAFGAGDINFADATFGAGDVNFANARFGDGDVYFVNATFGDGDVYFVNARFGGGDVSFAHTAFGAGAVSFTGASVGGAFVFSPQTSAGAKRLRALSFRRCRFDGVVILEGIFSCIPNLRSTITQGHVDLQNLRLEHWTLDWSWPWIGFSKDPDNDIPALRRLKELAEANRHHDAAMRFFGDERRAMRWHPRHLGKAASWLEWIYDGLSRYGQSVARPIVGLFVSTLVFARILFDLATQAPKQGVWMFGEALSASIANTLPFIPSVRAVRIDALDTLFGQDPSFWVDIMNIGQGAVSFVFLFLIGLGLRNRFRL